MIEPQPQTTVDPIHSEYRLECASCRGDYDALCAPWCLCLVAEHTLVCPHCAACFCKASVPYKQRVWRGAPAALRDRQAEARGPAVAEELHDLNRPLVLLVEDEPDVRRLASAVIRSLGYGLIVADNGAEGLALAQEYRPELVLTDALMPKMDGREMCRQIKTDPKCRGTRVVVMTALYTNYRYEREAYKSFKVDGYVTKPLAIDRLCQLLREELG
jgi:CheY-like chemotaxis protein